MATLGGILAIAGGILYLLSTVLKSNGSSLVGFGQGGPTKYVIAGILGYWPGAIFLVVGGILGCGPQRALALAAGMCLATGIWALTTSGSLFLYDFNGFAAWLGVVGSTAGVAGGILLTVAAAQARRQSG